MGSEWTKTGRPNSRQVALEREARGKFLTISITKGQKQRKFPGQGLGRRSRKCTKSKMEKGEKNKLSITNTQTGEERFDMWCQKEQMERGWSGAKKGRK